jgi:uncharacterized RDD family membrane protein YckC
MKCPYCQLSFSDLRDVCPKCLSDLRDHKREGGIAVTYPDLDYPTLLQRSGLLPSDSPIPEPVAIAHPEAHAPTPAPAPAPASAVIADAPPADSAAAAAPAAAAPLDERDAFGFTATDRLEISLTFAETGRSLGVAQNDEFELGFSQLFGSSETENIKLLFDLADESLVNPDAAKRLERDIIHSESRQVESKELTSQLARISHVLEASAVRLKNVFGGGSNAEEDAAAPEVRIVPAKPSDRAAAGLIDFAVAGLLAAVPALGFLYLYRQQAFVDLLELQIPDVVDILLPTAVLVAGFLWIAPLYLAATAALFGKTLGMRACKLSLVRMNGKPPRAIHAFVRSFSLMLGALGLGVVPWLYHERAPHDRFAGTAVVPTNTLR